MDSQPTLNRAARRAAKKAKPPRRGAGHVQLPINMRFSAENETAMMLVPTQCAARFLDGTADESDWNALTHRLNWARLLNEKHYAEGLQAFIDAQQVMAGVKPRGLAEGVWSITAEQHAALETALALANQMQKQCNRRELRDALSETYGEYAYERQANAIKDRLDSGQS